jgi:hypothetical protein
MRGLALASALALLAAAPAWAQATPSKCNAAKLKATGAYAQAILGCQAKAVQKGDSIDGDCLQKAIDKLGKAFEKAEKKGDCAGSGGAATAQSQADAFRISLGEALLPPKTCCAFTSVCGWEDDAFACTMAGGTPGADGSACDGESGACVAGPLASGACCENGGECNGGAVGISECTGAGGTFIEGGICLASGECLAH